MELDSKLFDEEILSSGEEDDTDDRKHSQLLDAISSLDGKKKQRLSQRTVLSNQISEFNFTSSKDDASLVKLHELVGSLKESTSHGELKKQLRTIDKSKKTVSTPLPRHEKEKIDRSTAYDTVTEDLSKWDPIVKKNRKADQLQFPLQKQDFRIVSTTQLVKKFQPRTPLERQVAELLQGSECVTHGREQELTPAEQRALKAMDLQEAKERRLELMKHRALLSYKEAKAKRQKKIKSKRYHKILKKERLKNERKELEKMEQQDPEGYQDKLNQVERDRAQERVSLKHRGGSKFAKRQMIYAKYDDRARQEVQEMLQKSRELTKKLEADSDSDTDEKFPDSGVVLDAEDNDLGLDWKTDNPWMAKPGSRKSGSQFSRPGVVENRDNTNDVEISEYSRPAEVINADASNGKNNKDNNSTSNVENSVEKDKLLQRDSGKKNTNKTDVYDLSTIKFSESSVKSAREPNITKISEIMDEIFDIKTKQKAHSGKSKSKRRKNKAKKTEGKIKDGTKSKPEKKTVETEHTEEINYNDDSDNSEPEHEREDIDEGNDSDGNEGFDDKEEDTEHEDLNVESLKRKRTLEDLESASDDEAEELSAAKKTKSDNRGTGRGDKQGSDNKSKEEEVFVDPRKLFTVETKMRQVGPGPTIVDAEDDDDDSEDQQRMTIAQAFADDDVIDEFTREKDDVIEKSKPKDIDLTLPGWGSWGGEGIQISKKKKKRFTIKAPPALPRKDEHLGHVILNEARHTAVSKHRVNEIPFPYRNVEQFEKSIRAPIGKAWNPETVHRDLVKPKVVTAIGKIIAPMDKSEVFKNQKMKGKSDLGGKQSKSGKKLSRKERMKMNLKNNPKSDRAPDPKSSVKTKNK